jgi:hypothetical protein
VPHAQVNMRIDEAGIALTSYAPRRLFPGRPQAHIAALRGRSYAQGPAAPGPAPAAAVPELGPVAVGDAAWQLGAAEAAEELQMAEGWPAGGHVAEGLPHVRENGARRGAQGEHAYNGAGVDAALLKAQQELASAL